MMYKNFFFEEQFTFDEEPQFEMEMPMEMPMDTFQFAEEFIEEFFMEFEPQFYNGDRRHDNGRRAYCYVY
jgi:alpha-L-arabinofuranosidase